jgi:hypothetical protein
MPRTTQGIQEFRARRLGPRTWEVRRWNGAAYHPYVNVTESAHDVLRCSCTWFEQHGRCRHLAVVAREVVREQASPVVLRLHRLERQENGRTAYRSDLHQGLVMLGSGVVAKLGDPDLILIELRPTSDENR